MALFRQSVDSFSSQANVQSPCLLIPHNKELTWGGGVFEKSSGTTEVARTIATVFYMDSTLPLTQCGLEEASNFPPISSTVETGVNSMGSEVSSGPKSLSFSSPPEFLPFPEPPASASWHDSVTSPVSEPPHQGLGVGRECLSGGKEPGSPPGAPQGWSQPKHFLRNVTTSV